MPCELLSKLFRYRAWLKSQTTWQGIWTFSCVISVHIIFDNFSWHKLISLKCVDETQSINVHLSVFPIPGRSSCRCEQSPFLQETYFRRPHLGELGVNML